MKKVIETSQLLYFTTLSSCQNGVRGRLIRIQTTLNSTQLVMNMQIVLESLRNKTDCTADDCCSCQ